MAKNGSSDGGATGVMEIDVKAFEGQEPRRINLANPAPFGYSIAFTLGLIALIDRADSALVGGVLPTLQDYFGFSDFTAGILLSAPSVASLLLVVPAGRLADTRSRKMVLTVVIFTWGVLTFGAAAAPTFALFFLARVLLGIATPLTIPASASVVGDLYRTQARTKAFAIVRVMEYLGFPLGVAIGGIVGGALGWRAAFLVMGVPALVMATVVLLFFREPKRGLADDLTVRAARAGLDEAVDDTDEHSGFTTTTDPGDPVNMAHAADIDTTQPGVWRRTKDVLSIPTLRWIVIGQALLFAGFTGLFSFAPTFFFRVQGLAEGAAAGISGGVGLLGLLAGGAFASRIGDRYQGVRPGWRVFVAAVSLTVASVSVLFFTTITVFWLQIVLFVLINFANIIALANLGAVQADVLPARMRGTGFATAQFLVTIGSSFGAIVVGTVSSFVIRSTTEVTQAQVTDAEAALATAQDAGQSQAVLDGLQGVVDELLAVFGPAQALGIRWGIGALFVVLITGSVTIFRARATYEADAAKVIEEAEAASGRE